jgi:dolichyl-phosphate beta-glucosyltransferase
MTRTCTVVVPCFNEADRLETNAFVELAAHDGVSVLMIDDGSTDATADVLAALARRSGSIAVEELGANR